MDVSINATQTGNITLQVSGSGKQYDYSTVPPMMQPKLPL
jgi:hypothetical protein